MKLNYHTVLLAALVAALLFLALSSCAPLRTRDDWQYQAEKLEAVFADLEHVAESESRKEILTHASEIVGEVARAIESWQGAGDGSIDDIRLVLLLNIAHDELGRLLKGEDVDEDLKLAITAARIALRDMIHNLGGS